MKMRQPLAQVTRGIFDGSFSRAFRFSMGFQRSQYLSDMASKQSTLLLLQPSAGFSGANDRHSGCRQVFTDVVKVDEVFALGAEVVFELLHDPGRAITDPMYERSIVQSTTQGGLAPKQ